MRWMEGLGWILLAAVFCSISTLPSGAQTVSFSEKLLINASSASSWAAGNTNVVQLQGPVSITMDDVKCSADQAVIWLTPSPDGLLTEQQADIVLLGHAKLAAQENHLTRTAGTLLVNTIVRGTIELTVSSKLSEDQSQSAIISASPDRPRRGQFPIGRPIRFQSGPGRGNQHHLGSPSRDFRRHQRGRSHSARIRQGQFHQVRRQAHTGN